MLKHILYILFLFVVLITSCDQVFESSKPCEQRSLSGVESYPIQIERPSLVFVGDIPVVVERKPVEKPKDYVEMTVTATAYCPCRRCCGPYARGLTKTESNAWGPGVAVDPRVIPLGSVLVVPGFNGDKPIFADDIGGKIKGKRIDVRMKYHWQAKEWGTQVLVVRVYKPR